MRPWKIICSSKNKKIITIYALHQVVLISRKMMARITDVGRQVEAIRSTNLL